MRLWNCALLYYLANKTFTITSVYSSGNLAKTIPVYFPLISSVIRREGHRRTRRNCLVRNGSRPPIGGNYVLNPRVFFASPGTLRRTELRAFRDLWETAAEERTRTCALFSAAAIFCGPEDREIYRPA